MPVWWHKPLSSFSAMNTTVFWLRQLSGLWHPSLCAHTDSVKNWCSFNHLWNKGVFPIPAGIFHLLSLLCHVNPSTASIPQLPHSLCNPLHLSFSSLAAAQYLAVSIKLLSLFCTQSFQRTSLLFLLSHTTAEQLSFLHKIHCLCSHHFPLSFPPPPEKLQCARLL